MQDLFRSVNPRTEELLASYPALSKGELDKCIVKAQVAQKAWSALSIKERCRGVNAVGEFLETHADKYAQLIEFEMGKCSDEALAEVKKCASLCFYSALQAKEVLEDSIEQLGEAKVVVRHEPLGIVFAVMPWNFPFWQVFRAAVPTLLAGNVIVFKHAANTPQCAMAIEEIFSRCIKGMAVMQSMFIDHEQSSALIADGRISAVTLTGSKRAGVAVAVAAAQAVKPCVLELGGSDPFLVFSDADLETAVKVAAASRCLNNGQSCISAKRFIVERSIFDEFLAEMTKEMASKEMRPQATKQQQMTLNQQVQDAVEKGARVHCGGYVPAGKGYFYPPTVLSNVDKTMRVFGEEVFGPVATVYSFKDDNEALRIANESVFGLASTIFTNDADRAERFARELACGQVFVNHMVRSDPRIPFGGVKESGFGRELGPRASLAFTNEKVVWANKTKKLF